MRQFGPPHAQQGYWFIGTIAKKGHDYKSPAAWSQVIVDVS